MTRVGALFAGYGGLELAVSRVFPDARPVWFSQFDPTQTRQAPSMILARHWPNVPNHGDITRINWSQVEPVDILTGGFPCQDVSHAGRRAGLIRGETRTGLWGRITRNDMLKALGNGVVPQQAEAAIRHLLTVQAAALSGRWAA